MAGWKIPDPIYDPFNGNIVINYYWLVVSTPLKNMKVRLDHHPNYWGK